MTAMIVAGWVGTGIAALAYMGWVARENIAAQLPNERARDIALACMAALLTAAIAGPLMWVVVASIYFWIREWRK